jgi:hypothetical protein
MTRDNPMMPPFTLDDVVAIVKPHNDKIVAEHRLSQALNALEALTNQIEADGLCLKFHGWRAAYTVLQDNRRRQ